MKKCVLAMVIALALASPVAALASGYSAVSGLSGVSANGSPHTVVGTTSHGTLPFTGLDTGLLAGAGLLLLGGGFVLRLGAKQRSGS